MAQRQIFNFVFIFVLMSFKEIIDLAQTTPTWKKNKVHLSKAHNQAGDGGMKHSSKLLIV